MVLSKYSERFGMTLSNLLSIIGLVILLVGFIINSQVQVESIKADIQAVDIKYQLKYEAIERNSYINATDIETIRKENREDHYIISVKIDEVLKVVKR